MSPSTAILKVNGQEVTVYIHTERRTNARVSIGKKGITIRLPFFLTPDQRQQQIAAFKEWAYHTYAAKPELIERGKPKKYVDGHTFILMGEVFTLNLEEVPLNSFTARLYNNVVLIRLPQGTTTAERDKAIPQLISRVVAKKYYTAMHHKLLYLNKLYFDKPVKDFKLKYTNSLWGSCSSKGNINISTRLFFAPEEVIDYVMVHELAHLVHPNHSDAFWNEVERCLPNYMDQERWLKKHGRECDF
ncbi:M48 family metallopeptidase [soil metagenome]